MFVKMIEINKVNMVSQNGLCRLNKNKPQSMLLKSSIEYSPRKRKAKFFPPYSVL